MSMESKDLCPDCLSILRFDESTFEQYQPSAYYCENCNKSFSPIFVRGFNRGYKKGVEDGRMCVCIAKRLIEKGYSKRHQPELFPLDDEKFIVVFLEAIGILNSQRISKGDNVIRIWKTEWPIIAQIVCSTFGKPARKEVSVEDIELIVKDNLVYAPAPQVVNSQTRKNQIKNCSERIALAIHNAIYKGE